ncbi:hypothetical protein [Vibrio sp. M260112]|uniref:hypothetical protein n=1 Tax=Vibrio sp. M260112 TaxID=3020895 RepID=UPI002F4049CF
MRKIKVISLILISLLIIWLNFEFDNDKSLDKEILNVKITKSLSLSGFRMNTGGATVPFRYVYFINHKENKTPFLITNSNSIKVDIINDKHITINVIGEIYEYTNAIWFGDTTLHPLTIDLISKSTLKAPNQRFGTQKKEE